MRDIILYVIPHVYGRWGYKLCSSHILCPFLTLGRINYSVYFTVSELSFCFCRQSTSLYSVSLSNLTLLRAFLNVLLHLQDIYFVSDCGENVLRALAEPTLVVRAKAAWALGNLSDALVLNM